MRLHLRLEALEFLAYPLNLVCQEFPVAPAYPAFLSHLAYPLNLECQ